MARLGPKYRALGHVEVEDGEDKRNLAGEGEEKNVDVDKATSVQELTPNPGSGGTA